MTLLEFFNSRSIPFRHSSKPNEIWVCCPICGDDKYRLGVNLQTNLARCFKGDCGFKSRKASVAIAYHFNVTRFSGDHIEAIKRTYKPVRLPEDFTPIYRGTDSLTIRARRYAESRGLDKALAKKWEVGVSLMGRFGYRVIFPIRTDRLVGLIARDFTGTQEPKYLFHSGPKHIWGLRRTADLQLCEGNFKALAVEKAIGIPAGALLGNGLSDDMLQSIVDSRVKRAILWPDPDQAGVSGFLKVGKVLADAGIQVYMPEQLTAKPTDDMTQAEIQAAAVFQNYFKLVSRYKRDMAWHR